MSCGSSLLRVHCDEKAVSLQLLCDFLWCCLGARRRCTNLHVQECSVVDAGIVR